MAALHIYAKMADNVYEVPDATKLLNDLPGWSVYNTAGSAAGFTGGTVHNSGFKGCIYTGPNEVVVAFKGTGGGKLFQDILADANQASTRRGAAGFNYRVQGDPVSSRKLSALGHYGKVITIKTPLISGITPLDAHSMTRFHDYLSRSSDGHMDPFVDG